MRLTAASPQFRDVGGLGRPGGEGAEARHHEVQPAFGHRRWFAVGEQPLKQRALACAERRFELDEVPKFRAERA